MAHDLSSVLKACLVILVAGLGPARACMVQGMPDADGDLKVEAASHQAGAKHPAVAGIYLAGGKVDLQTSNGTGIYIGSSHDGRKGFLLTAAHLFNYDPVRPAALHYERVYAVFGADLAAAAGRVQVEARRVLLHPDFTSLHYGSLGGAAGHRRDPRPDIRDDVALLEFDLEPHAEELKAAGIAPAALHEAGAHRGLEGRPAAFLGFGSYGTTRGSLDPRNARVHQGPIVVTHGEYCGREALLNLAPASVEDQRLLQKGDTGTSLFYRFSPQAEPREVHLPACSKTLWLLTHPEQAVPTPGDSGGPLLMRGADGTLRVAGIVSRSARHRVRLAPWRKLRKGWALLSIFEPVGLHRDWIDRMREGKATGRAWVLEPGEGGWACAGPEETETCSVCVVM